MPNHVMDNSLGRRIGDIEIGSLLISVSLVFFMLSIFFRGLLPMASAVSYVSVVVIDAVALLKLGRRNVKFKLLPVAIILICFLSFVAANRYFSFDTGLGWLVFFSLCFIAAVLLGNDTVDWITIAVKIVAVCGVIHAVATIGFLVLPHLYTGWFKPHFYSGVTTATGYKSGLTNHYSTNGMYLAWGLITCFYNWQSAGRRDGRKWQLAALVVLAALLLTTKRMHLIVGIGSCLVVYLLLNSGKGSFKTTIKIVAFAIVALAVFYVASLYVPELAKVIARLQDVELDEARSSYYAICLDLFGSSPIVGHGWGSFTSALYQSGVSDLARLYRNGNLSQDAHNVYLQLLAEEGLVGLLLFLGAAVTSLVVSIRSALSRKYGVSGGLYALAVGIQVFFLLYCFTGNPLYEPVEYSIYLIIGISLSLSRSAGVVRGNASFPDGLTETYIDKA